MLRGSRAKGFWSRLVGPLNTLGLGLYAGARNGGWRGSGGYLYILLNWKGLKGWVIFRLKRGRGLGGLGLLSLYSLSSISIRKGCIRGSYRGYYRSSLLSIRGFRVYCIL